jgi:hypothetical protein
MLKRAVSLGLVLVLILFVVSAGFAVIKGLEKGKQSLIKVGESITIPEGAEIRSAVAIGGSITVYGQVLEDVVAVGGSVYLKDSAVVGGDVVAVGGKIMREPGAITRGDLVEVSIGGLTPLVAYLAKGGILRGIAFFWLLNIIGFIVLAIILVALFTPQLGRISSCLEKDLLGNFMVGLLVMILFFPVIFFLIFTLVGIILIPLLVAVLGVGWVLGYVGASHLLGKKVLHAFRIYGKSMMVETLTGVILLCLAGLIPLGGTLLKIIVALCGLGAVYWTRFGTAS